MTKDEWWDVCNAAWPKILEIAKNINIDLNTTNYAIVPNADPIPQDMPLGDFLEGCREKKDENILQMWLSEIWWRAPDRPFIHDWPGWPDLCELLDRYPDVFLEQEDAYLND